MKKRNILAVIFLSIITLGIYDLFWLVKTKKVLNAQTKEHIPSIWVLFSPILILAILTLLLVITRGSSGSGSGSALIFLLVDFLTVLAIVPITFIWFFKFSKAVNEYTNGELSTAITFILLWLLRFIGLAVIQDKFNDMIAAGTSAGPAPVQPAAFMPPAAPVASMGQDVVPPSPAFQAPVQPVAPVIPEAPAAFTPTVEQTPPTPETEQLAVAPQPEPQTFASEPQAWMPSTSEEPAEVVESSPAPSESESPSDAAPQPQEPAEPVQPWTPPAPDSSSDATDTDDSDAPSQPPTPPANPIG